MVRHVELGAAAWDSGALAEGVWEYVSDLVKSYRSQNGDIQDLEPYKVIVVLFMFTPYFKDFVSCEETRCSNFPKKILNIKK